jgi:hypothetical protein
MKTAIAAVAVLAVMLAAIAALVFVASSPLHDEPPSTVTHRMGAINPVNGSPNFNDPVITGGICLDTEPQPLAYVDASLSDGGTQDGGWYADAGAGRIPKALLLACSGTTANVAVDMLGFGGKPGQTNVVLTGVACGVPLPFAVTKVYQVGTTATTVQICY